jgi:Zn-finger nucleic acid-binding protein
MAWYNGAMNCPNCGAPMELFAARRYYFCHHCGTFHFLENPAVDGVQVLERPAAPRPCPRCRATLATARLDDAHTVEHCERCRGLLLPRASFAEAVGRRRARASGPPATPSPIDPREMQTRISCPACAALMDVHPYYGPGNVVIDTCSGCDLVWLDFGELQQITDAPGRDRGQAPRPADPPSSAAPPLRGGRTRLSVLDAFDALF